VAVQFNKIDQLVKRAEFRLNKQVSDRIHGLVAVHEAVESGTFRGEGLVTGGGAVRLSGGSAVDGRTTGEGGAGLREADDSLVDYLSTEPDPHIRAQAYARSAIRHQF
jgi:hypothetical protein